MSDIYVISRDQLRGIQSQVSENDSRIISHLQLFDGEKVARNGYSIWHRYFLWFSCTLTCLSGTIQCVRLISLCYHYKNHLGMIRFKLLLKLLNMHYKKCLDLLNS